MTEKKLPAPYFVSAESLVAWTREAAAGAKTVYARAAFLPKGSLTAGKVRALREAGFLEIWQEREEADRFRYCARRTAKAWPAGMSDIGGAPARGVAA